MADSNPGFAVVVKPGDMVLLCIEETGVRREWLDDMIGQLKEKLPGVQFGFIAGVSGVVVRRENE